MSGTRRGRYKWSTASIRGARRGNAGGDADAIELDPDAFDRLWQIDVKGMWLAARQVILVMRTQRSGPIVNISSMAVRHAYPLVGYKTTKTAVLGLPRISPRTTLRTANLA